MAEWNPSTAYGFGATVTYLGLTYIRSQYPITATAGTNPKQEMGIDPKGDPIRTWELRLPSSNVVTVPFHSGYFSLKAADRSDGTYIKEPPLEVYPGKFAPQNPYAGESDIQQSAYGYTNFPSPVTEVLGQSVEMDQERAATPAGISPPTPAIPAAPAMPANKCGLALQQYQETPVPEPIPTDPYLDATNAYANSGLRVYENLTYDPETETWYQDPSARPRTYYVFLEFNHPLYFRRQHTITFRISTYTYTGGYAIPDTDPPVVVPPTFEGVYSSTTKSVTPTDENFWTFTNQFGEVDLNPANAVTTYILPDDETSEGPYGSTDGVNYEIVEIFISDIESND